MSKDNEQRHTELSDKIFDMSLALISEGEDKDDYIITNTGNIMMLISGLLHDPKDMVFFSELCDMFSAKKVLDNQIELGSLDDLHEDDLFRMFSNLNNEINEDLDNEDLDNEEDEKD